MSRNVIKVIEDSELKLREGVYISRHIGVEGFHLDPFVLFDSFKLKLPGGFPDHPHRGFESITYVLQGSFEHENSFGMKGTLNPGDMQWVTMGRGLLHCFASNADKLSHGLNLWLNLSNKHKLTQPIYQELLKEDIPISESRHVTTKVIAGEFVGVKSPIRSTTPILILDIHLDKGITFTKTLPYNWNSFIYVMSGVAQFGPKDKAKKGAANQTIVFDNGHDVKIHNDGNTVLRFLLIAGQPLHEPMIHDGTWVMNSHAELLQSYEDFHNQRNGFEGTHSWHSELARKINTPPPNRASLRSKV